MVAPGRRRFFFGAGACALGAAGLSGCAVQTRQLRATPPADLPAQVELRDTPFFPDETYYCGPAALATVLETAGFPAQPEALARQVFLPDRKGSLQLEMLVGTRRNGAIATVIPEQLDAVMGEVAAGNPVVVLQNLGLSWAPSWHYAVVVGYDFNAAEFILRSGTIKRHRLAFRTFEHTWKRGGHWAFVALPPGRLAATAGEAATSRALVAFERSGSPAQAEKAYAAGLARWPDNLVLAMGLGNARYAGGDLAGAEQAFSAAAQRHDAPAAYNNLAIVLLERGKIDAARDAAQRAVALASPDDEIGRETLRRIEDR